MLKRKWKVLARHKWAEGATITESVDEKDSRIRRFTATIRGYRNWRIWRGRVDSLEFDPRLSVLEPVKAIAARIDANDETVFHEKGAW